jgi:hypothetical protein
MIRPGVTWKFRAPVNELKTASYRFAEVDGDQRAPGTSDMDPQAKEKLQRIRQHTQESLERIMKDVKEKRK